jgi:hypothetical protein
MFQIRSNGHCHPRIRRERARPRVSGEMAEWFKARAWKACVGLYPTGSSNLSLSARLQTKID